MIKRVRVAMEVDSHFISMLNATVQLSPRTRMGDDEDSCQLTAAEVLARTFLAEARGGLVAEVDATIPDEWVGHINAVSDLREVTEES